VATSNWVILELSEYGEKADYSEVIKSIFSFFGEVEHFIPTHHEQMGSYVSTSILFEGYAFIKDSDSVRAKLYDFKESRIFSGVLRSRGKVQTVDSKTIGILKRKLKNSVKKKVKTGTKVRIMEGIFENLEGEVMSLEDGGRRAIVKVKQLSREMIAPIPTTSIKEIS